LRALVALEFVETRNSFLDTDVPTATYKAAVTSQSPALRDIEVTVNHEPDPPP
jgi:hypothetical protein